MNRFALALATVLAGAGAPLVVIDLPSTGPVGFDDLTWAPHLGRVLVPAGRTGTLLLLDPATRTFEAIPGFGTTGGAGHGSGTTSADEGPEGLVFASDRSDHRVVVASTTRHKIVGWAALSAAPDYVRWVDPTREVWVTEPGAESIEVFALGSGGRLARVGAVHVAGGPESLVVDPAQGAAYSHRWRGETVRIDLKTRRVTTSWKNGCRESQGIALDAVRELLFTGCGEGAATVVNLANRRLLSTAPAPAGVDIIAFDALHRRLFAPGDEAGNMAVLAVSTSGKLTPAQTVSVAKGAHCVVVDERGDAFVCDPESGRLLELPAP